MLTAGYCWLGYAASLNQAAQHQYSNPIQITQWRGARTPWAPRDIVYIAFGVKDEYLKWPGATLSFRIDIIELIRAGQHSNIGTEVSEKLTEMPLNKWQQPLIFIPLTKWSSRFLKINSKLNFFMLKIAVLFISRILCSKP